jgi:hypothetical protein
MKRIIFITLFSFCAIFFISISITKAENLSQRLSGRILLQVELKGEAWYVYPDNLQRYYLGRPTDAFDIMKKLGLGAKHDFIVSNAIFSKNVWGKILLDVEENGEAYYIYPGDGKKYYLGRPVDAFNVMRKFGLGINNSDLSLIISNDTSDWRLFKSSFFTLSFKIPNGFEVKEDANQILIAQTPYYTREIGDDNSFFNLIRYNKDDTKENKLSLCRKLLKNKQESNITIDNSSFLILTGEDSGRFEGDSAGKVNAIFFDASYLEIIERPANSDQSFDPISISNQILSTFKFSK